MQVCVCESNVVICSLSNSWWTGTKKGLFVGWECNIGCHLFLVLHVSRHSLMTAGWEKCNLWLVMAVLCSKLISSQRKAWVCPGREGN